MWVGLQYTLVEREPSSLCNIVTSKNGITCPCTLSEVNRMFWLMELIWASIPSTWSAGTAVKYKDIIHIISLPEYSRDW